MAPVAEHTAQELVVTVVVVVDGGTIDEGVLVLSVTAKIKNIYFFMTKLSLIRHYHDQ